MRKKRRCSRTPTIVRELRKRCSKAFERTLGPVPHRRRKEMNAMAEILHVGIDLGTSRSAISASNGERFVVDSFVGWPLDMVAKKVLKREVLIGHEAVSNR